MDGESNKEETPGEIIQRKARAYWEDPSEENFRELYPIIRAVAWRVHRTKSLVVEYSPRYGDRKVRTFCSFVHFVGEFPTYDFEDGFHYALEYFLRAFPKYDPFRKNSSFWAWCFLILGRGFERYVVYAYRDHELFTGRRLGLFREVITLDGKVRYIDSESSRPVSKKAVYCLPYWGTEESEKPFLQKDIKGALMTLLADNTLRKRTRGLIYGILILRFGLQGNRVHTLGEIGEALDFTRERVRQLEDRGLHILRTSIKSRGLRDWWMEDPSEI